MLEWFDPDVVFRVVDVSGVVANGLLGGTLARRKGYDPIGFVTLAVCAGLGGGILRDVMLGQGFPVALTDPFYLSGALVAALLAYLLDVRSVWAVLALMFADFLVLGAWSATGASKALSAGLGWVPAVFLGVLTAVGGGIIRDVVANRVPEVFGGKPVYATLAIVTSLQMVVMQSLGRPTLGMAIAIVLSGVLGVAAHRFDWVLPAAPERLLPRARRQGDEDAEGDEID